MPVTNNKGGWGAQQPRPAAPPTHPKGAIQVKGQGKHNASPHADSPIGATAKRQRVQALLVSASHGDEVEGLEVLLGRFEACGSRQNAGYPVYEKIEASGRQPVSEPCFLYFWTDEDDPSQDGWWFGDEVGGSMVYCVNPQAGMPPPASGWRIPADDGGPIIECLRVEPAPVPATIAPRHASNPVLKGGANSPASASNSDAPTTGARRLIDDKLDQWVSAKRDRQFTRADHIRQELQAQGIEPEVERADMKLMREGATRAPATSPTATESVAAGKGSKGSKKGAASLPPRVAQREPPRVENCQRYGFTEENSPLGSLLGLGISSGFPVVIESVNSGSAAHQLRVPTNGIIYAVNGEVVKAEDHLFKQAFGRRPLYLDVKPPAAAGAPAGGKSSGKVGLRPDAATASNLGPQHVPPPNHAQQSQKQQQAPQAQSAQGQAGWAQQMLAATLGANKPQQGVQRPAFGPTGAAAQGTSSAGGAATPWGANGASQQQPLRPQQPPTGPGQRTAQQAPQHFPAAVRPQQPAQQPSAAASKPASGGTEQTQSHTSGSSKSSYQYTAAAPAGEDSQNYKWQQVREGASQRLATVVSSLPEDEVETLIRFLDVCEKEKSNGGKRTAWDKMQYLSGNPPAEKHAGGYNNTGGKNDWSSSSWGQKH